MRSVQCHYYTMKNSAIPCSLSSQQAYDIASVRDHNFTQAMHQEEIINNDIIIRYHSIMTGHEATWELLSFGVSPLSLLLFPNKSEWMHLCISLGI